MLLKVFANAPTGHGTASLGGEIIAAPYSKMRIFIFPKGFTYLQVKLCPGFPILSCITLYDPMKVGDWINVRCLGVKAGSWALALGLRGRPPKGDRVQRGITKLSLARMSLLRGGYAHQKVFGQAELLCLGRLEKGFQATTAFRCYWNTGIWQLTRLPVSKAT